MAAGMSPRAHASRAFQVWLSPSNRFVDRQRAPLLQPGTERLALDEGHHIPRQALGGAGGEQRNDMGMLEGGGDLDLAREALGLHAGRHFGRQHLHNYRPRQVDLGGQEDPAHPAARELPLDPIGRAEGSLEAVGQVGHRDSRRRRVGPPKLPPKRSSG